MRDEDCEEHTLLNLAVLDGDVAHSNLLKFALSESNYTDTTVMICTSMSTPWSIMDQLNKWIGVLQDHIDSLALTRDQVQEYRQSWRDTWESYAQPGMDFTRWAESEAPPLGSPSQEQFPMTDLSPTEEQKSLEMFDGVLSRNLGLEVVVVLTKTDSMTSLEAEHGLSDQHFDFIQQSIR